jgi:hypothetical protein
MKMIDVMFPQALLSVFLLFNVVFAASGPLSDQEGKIPSDYQLDHSFDLD